MPERPPKKRPARGAAPAASGFTQAQVDAAVAARDQTAAGNPRVVRRAFLGGQPIRLGELTIQPLTIGTFWLLEEIKSPLAQGVEGDAAPAPVTFRELAEAAFILTDPLRAFDVLAEGRPAFTRVAFTVAQQVPIEDLNGLHAALTGRVAEAAEVMPPPDAAAGTNPLEPPARTQVSAGG